MADETPNLRWFEPLGRCRCGKPGTGILRGERNESYGAHCQKCADKRLKASKRVRAATHPVNIDQFETRKDAQR